MAALAVGFAVSVAQYLPTLFAGGGRFVTVTTEAVALSAGGNRRVLAVQALLQIALPMAAFALTALLPYCVGRHRKGLR
jgi:putative thiamine transport system permease protein